MVKPAKQTKEIEITGPTSIVSVIGADTYFGSHMVKHLASANRMVYGFTQQKPFSFKQPPIFIDGLEKAAIEPAPIVSDCLFICVDPSIGFDKYVKWMRGFCKEIIAKEFWGRICFLSSGGICRSRCDEPISEDTIVSPRTEMDLSLATAENLLEVMRNNRRNLAEVTVARIGVPYGNETGIDDLNVFVNQAVKQAIVREAIGLPAHQAKRSFAHISDICDSIIKVMSLKFCPELVNIPGEVLTIRDFVNVVSESFDVKRESAYGLYNDQDFFLGDQHLSDELFNQTVSYSRKYSLKKWLNGLKNNRNVGRLSEIVAFPSVH